MTISLPSPREIAGFKESDLFGLATKRRSLHAVFRGSKWVKFQRLCLASATRLQADCFQNGFVELLDRKARRCNKTLFRRQVTLRGTYEHNRNVAVHH